MTLRARFLVHIFFLTASLFSVHAQTSPSPKSTPPAKSTNSAKSSEKKTTALEEAKRLEEQRRATAIAVLISTADEARSYRDQTLRARVQARAADLLWTSDIEKARTLFRRAWEAADLADNENQRRLEDERRQSAREGRSLPRANPPSLRTEVLRMATRRDRKLGDEMLAKLEEAKKQEAANTPSQQNNPLEESGNPFELPSELRLRLKVAQQLLDSDVTRAIEFADPALGRVSIDGLVFLTYLRAKNPLAADERYATMLGIAGADVASDANFISLLSSYILTPFLFITYTADGGTNSSRYNEPGPAPAVSSELRNAFFRVAEQVFLRPQPPPEQDNTTSGRTGKYLVMTRLLPYFEQYASEQSTTLLKAQITALAREVPDQYTRRRPATETSADNYDNDDSSGDSIQSILNRIEKTSDQTERDNLYAQVAVMASEKNDPRAFEFADKIENTEMRKSVRAYVDFNATRNAIEAKRMDDAIKFARTGALSSMQRVWALTQIARSFSKSDRERTIELLDEALIEARRIGGSSADRPRALVGVASAFYEASRTTAWEMMSEVVRAANNASEVFSGADAIIVSSLQTSNQTSMLTFTAEGMDLPDIFRLFAREDLHRAILLAKDFNGESPRALALIAIARATLETKPAAESKK